MTLFVLRCGSLGHSFVLLSLGRKVDRRLVEHHLTVDDTLVRSLDKAKLVNLSIDTERGDKTDVRSFRSLNGAKTTIVSVVDVTYLETCTLTRQTARTES